MILRRFASIPGYLLAWILCVAGAPLWLPVAAVVDALRRRGSVALRSLAFLTVFLTCEIVGLACCAGLWAWRALARPDVHRWQEAHFRLEAWWGSTILGALVHLFGLEIAVEGDAQLARGPYVLLIRHASSADTLLASALVSRPHGIHLRYVLKRELLWDPCLDIVGNRLPNVFLDRGAEDSTVEIERVRALAEGLGPRDGVLLYPEGTRFSAAKRDRVLARFRRAGDEESAAYTASLQHMLPPRPRGTLALLAAAPEADVVVCAHTGFESTASFGQIWNGALIGRRVRVVFRRIPREQVPMEPAAAVAWLRDEWRRSDRWIASEAG